MTDRNVIFDFEDYFNELMAEVDALRSQAQKEGKNHYKITITPERPRQPKTRTFKPIAIPAIKRVMFNDPATIVMFEDGSKTVARSEDGDPYDKETGVAICIAKRVLGNAGYREVMNQHVYDDEEDDCSRCKPHYSYRHTPARGIS